MMEKLANDEKILHDELQDLPRHVLRCKRILLFKTLLDEANWRDRDLIYDICRGMLVVGQVPRSTIFPAKHSPASKSVEDLLRAAEEWQRKLHTYLKSISPEIDRATREGTY